MRAETQEAGERQRTHQSDHRSTHAGEPDRTAATSGGQEPTHQGPLADESVEWWQPDDGDRSKQKCPRRLRQHPRQSAQPVDLQRPRGTRNRPGAEKEEALEQGMVHHVQRCCRESQERQHRMVVCTAERAQRDSHHDDPDVVHAAVGKRPLEVALRQGPEHAKHGGRDAEHQETQAHQRGGSPKSVSTRSRP